MLTFLHWMLAVSITLFILDIFIQTEFISWGSLLIFALYFTMLLEANFDIPTQWLLLIFIIFLAIAFVFYYAVWCKLVKPSINKSLLRKATIEYADRASGETGVFRIIDGKFFIEWDGILWQASNVDTDVPLNNYADQEEVTIVKSELGKLYINKK